jgi:antitoxin (DNA-binding transcriptional repressor) of toxin-antitoxin stability system
MLTKIKRYSKIRIMKVLTAAEVKTHFSDILFQVKNGEKVKILHGKSKEPIAMIIPLENTNSPRKIGILDGIASFKEEGDGKISLGEFLGI